jgi:hypothetical protein
MKDVRRNVNIVVTPTEDKSYPSDYFSSPESYTGPIGPMNIPDISNINLSTPRSTSPLASLHPAAKEAAQSLCDLSKQTQQSSQGSTTTQRRKRSRPSSSDLSNALQQNVRELMVLKSLTGEDDSIVLPDSRYADSLVLDNRNVELLRASSAVRVMGSCKRACFGEEISKFARDQMAIPGPGMWNGILQ